MSTEPLENLEELARRAVACKRWRWMPGMRYQVGGTVGRLTDSQCKGKLPLVAETRPDLSDPATLGCLLALVREAWKNHTMSCFFDHADVAWSEYPWAVKLVGLRVVTGAYGQTEAGALVAALEAAP